eukprot:TRINITY_DN16932_c0_g1_i1.p1 TRINITY_DN16932_c0_g1~~TRINITY_DN16932_c0_g1_i1.p1  ORF type:complete len:425 (+),score=168.11 TRINITY_DN16932_c0_g1_i1:116-1276(+)
MRVVAAALLVGCAVGCSWVTVQTLDGKEVIGRTMELHGVAPSTPGKKEDLQDYWGLKKVPKGTPITPAAHTGKRCSPLNVTSWTAKYNHVGIGGLSFADEYDSLFDGMNDAGLVVDEQTLLQSGYQQPPEHPKESQQIICFTSFTAWILGNFATVREVQAALEADKFTSVYVVAPLGDTVNADYVHWVVADRLKESIVIEVINGAISIHNNTVKVMTNDPPFGFHLQNLQNYVNLNTKWQDRSDIAVNSEIGMVPLQANHGHSLLGLPGDLTPTGRFIRLFYLRGFGQLNIDLPTSSDGIELVQGLLNAVHIPKGVVAFRGTETDPNYDFTQYSTMKIPLELGYYYRTYQDLQWRYINLNNLSWASASTGFLRTYDSSPKDITSQL